MKFTDYKVHEASFSIVKGLAANKSYKIAPKIGCNIKKGTDKVLCTFTVELKKGDEPIPFELSLTGVGAFLLEENENVNDEIIKIAETVYPFVRSSVADLTRLANIPAYVLPLIDMSALLGVAPIVNEQPTNLN